MHNIYETLWCALIIVIYFVLMWLKAKFLKINNHPFLSILNFILNIVIFGGFVISILFAIKYDFTATNANLKDFLEEQGTRIVWTFIVVIIAATFYNTIKAFVYYEKKKPITEIKRRHTVDKVIMSLTRYAIYIACLIIILKIWGADIMPAIAGLGIAGLVLGLGAQQFISDFVSGAFIVFEHHFDVGDIIEISDFKGEVIDIGLKTTKIKNWKGQVKIISNSSLTNIINDSKFNSVVDLTVSIAYSENVVTAMKVLDAELAKRFANRDEVIIPPQCSGVQDLADSSIKIRIVATTKPESYYQLLRDIKLATIEIFNDKGIIIPFNQLVVHIGDKDDRSN